MKDFMESWADVVLFVAVLALVAAAFGANWMAYEQMRANRGIFLDPAAISAPDPSRAIQPEPAPTPRGL